MQLEPKRSTINPSPRPANAKATTKTKQKRHAADKIRTRDLCNTKHTQQRPFAPSKQTGQSTPPSPKGRYGILAGERPVLKSWESSVLYHWTTAAFCLLDRVWRFGIIWVVWGVSFASCCRGCLLSGVRMRVPGRIGGGG